MSSRFNKNIAKCFLSLIIFNFNNLYFNALPVNNKSDDKLTNIQQQSIDLDVNNSKSTRYNSEYNESNNNSITNDSQSSSTHMADSVIQKQQMPQVINDSLNSKVDNEYNKSKNNIFYGMKHLKKAVESILGRNFKNENVEKFISGIDSNKPFKYNDITVDPTSNPLIKELYKPVLESWLILREACNATFVYGTNRNPVIGMSRKNAFNFARTLGQAKDMGTYRRMSAIDFMEWWADSNNSFLTKSEQRILRKISEGKKFNFSKKFKNVDEMWETGNSAEFMDYWKVYGENTLQDVEMNEMDDVTCGL